MLNFIFRGREVEARTWYRMETNIRAIDAKEIFLTLRKQW